MDHVTASTLITALAAVLGTAVGGLVTFATQFFTQRYASRRDLLLKDLGNREALYAEFINESSRQFVDAIDRTLDKPSNLIALFALVGRIRLIGSEDVLHAAEVVGAEVLEAYMRPPMTVDELMHQKRREPLREFTIACRKEREQLLRSI